MEQANEVPASPSPRTYGDCAIDALEFLKPVLTMSAEETLAWSEALENPEKKLSELLALISVCEPIILILTVMAMKQQRPTDAPAP